MLGRLQRWGNKAAIAACAVPLHTWLREGDYDVRLKCFVHMHLAADTSLPATETCDREEIMARCKYLAFEFLYNFAKGTIAEGETNRKGDEVTNRNPPYGAGAVKEAHFMSVPKTWLAVTMAGLYPFLCEDRDQWSLRILGKLGNFKHPGTGLWPLRLVKRHVHFQTTINSNLTDMYGVYKDGGGTFEESSEEEEDDDEDEDEDDDEEGKESDCDNIF